MLEEFFINTEYEYLEYKEMHQQTGEWRLSNITM